MRVSVCKNSFAIEETRRNSILLSSHLADSWQGAAIAKGNFDLYAVDRMPGMSRILDHIVLSAEPPRGMVKPGLKPLVPGFANAISQLTSKTSRAPSLNMTGWSGPLRPVHSMFLGLMFCCKTAPNLGIELVRPMGIRIKFMQLAH